MQNIKGNNAEKPSGGPKGLCYGKEAPKGVGWLGWVRLG